MTADNSAPKQRGKPFPKGVSGNPKGRAQGSRNRATLLLDKLLTEEAEAVVRSVIEAAKAGDMTAARLVLDRVVPPRKERPVSAALPQIANAHDALAAMAAIVGAVTSGELTPGEGQAIAALVEGYRRAFETQELEDRVAALEAQERRS